MKKWFNFKKKSVPEQKTIFRCMGTKISEGRRRRQRGFIPWIRRHKILTTMSALVCTGGLIVSLFGTKIMNKINHLVEEFKSPFSISETEEDAKRKASDKKAVLVQTKTSNLDNKNEGLFMENKRIEETSLSLNNEEEPEIPKIEILESGLTEEEMFDTSTIDGKDQIKEEKVYEPNIGISIDGLTEEEMFDTSTVDGKDQIKEEKVYEPNIGISIDGLTEEEMFDTSTVDGKDLYTSGIVIDNITEENPVNNNVSVNNDKPSTATLAETTEVEEPEMVETTEVEEPEIIETVEAEEPEIIETVEAEESEMVEIAEVEEPEVVETTEVEEPEMVEIAEVEEPEMVEIAEVKEPEIIQPNDELDFIMNANDLNLELEVLYAVRNLICGNPMPEYQSTNEKILMYK